MDYEQMKKYIPEAAIPGFNKALSQIRSGSVDGAMHQLKSLTTSYGDHISGEIRSLLCQLEIHAGKFRQALRLSEELSEEFPDRTYYIVLKAQCLYLLEKNASALKTIRSIKQINDAYENYAIIYSSILNLNGMKSKSIDPFREAFHQWKEKDPVSMEPTDQAFGLIVGCDILGYEADDDIEKPAQKDLEEYISYLNGIQKPDKQACSLLAQHVSRLSGAAVQKAWSRKLLKQLLDHIQNLGFLSDYPETLNDAYVNIEYHDMDEDPKTFIAVKECLQAFGNIKDHQNSPQYDDHDQFMDQIDKATYQWIFAQLRKDHMKEIDYARNNYVAYWNEINDYLNEEEEIEKTQNKSVQALVQLTGMKEKQVIADLKDEYDKLIHIDPETLKDKKSS